VVTRCHSGAPVSPHILYANPAALRLFGAPYAQVLLDTPTADLIHPDSRAEQAARMKSITLHEAVAPMVEARFLRLNGSVMDVEEQGTAIDFDGKLAIHVVIRDITQRKKTERQVRQLAFYDALTELPNRRLLSDRMNRAIASARRSGNYGALMFIDLDNFKPVNDRYGHSVGDLLLVEVARRLKGCVREMDTVARFGGDEFVVLVEELATDHDTSARLAQGLAEKIRKSLCELYTIEKADANGLAQDISHRCTTSLGVAMIARTDNSPDDLVKWADAAMYQAKNNGRNRIRFHDPQKANTGEFLESASGHF
jgi:diguanylate cyclase (GGDEF)-like protein/PAS domain S-box-containing protein